MGGLALLVLLLLAAFILIGVPFAAARLSGSLVLRIVRVGGFAYAALVVLIAAGEVIPLIGGEGHVSVPLQIVRLERPHAVTFEQGPLAQITDGGVDRATLTLTGLGIPTRLELISATLIFAAVSVVIAVALSRIAGATLRGAPFLPGIARVITLAAVAIAVGGTLAAIMQQWGEWSAGQDALAVTAWSASNIGSGTTLADLGWPSVYLTLQIPFTPILIGVGLGAIAAVFRAGERLQRDTEGLV